MPTTDTIHSIAASLAHRRAAQVDDLIREALDRYLGKGNWGPQDVAARGTIRYYPSGSRIVSMGGVDILELLPEVTKIEEVDGQHRLTCAQEHRFLFPKE